MCPQLLSPELSQGYKNMRQETDRYRAIRVVEKMCKDRYDLFLECTKDYVESIKEALPKEYVEKWWLGDCPNAQQRVKEYLIEDILCVKFSYSFYIQPHPKAYKYYDEGEEEIKRRYPFLDTHLPNLPATEEEIRNHSEKEMIRRVLEATNPVYGNSSYLEELRPEEDQEGTYTGFSTYIWEMFNVSDNQNDSELLYDYLKQTADERDKCFKMLNEKISKLKKQEIINEMKTSVLMRAAT